MQRFYISHKPRQFRIKKFFVDSFHDIFKFWGQQLQIFSRDDTDDDTQAAVEQLQQLRVTIACTLW